MKGVFVISVDVEFAWGLVDVAISTGDYQRILAEREAIRRVLELFERYEIRGTWALVGHLCRERVEVSDGRAVPEIPRPVMRGETRDWLWQVGFGSAEVWCAPDVIEMIREARPVQEIGSHSFGHIRYCEEEANPAAIAADIRLAKEAHCKANLEFVSFVFPYNCVGFRKELREAGIRVYRGHTRRWYDGIRPIAAWRFMNLLTQAVGITPPLVRAERDEFGLVNIPDSMLLYHRQGLRRLIRSGTQVRMAQRAMAAAAREGKIFHLWFHPSNIAHQIEEQCATLERILRHACELMRQGRLENLTMKEIAQVCNNAGDAHEDT